MSVMDRARLDRLASIERHSSRRLARTCCAKVLPVGSNSRC